MHQSPRTKQLPGRMEALRLVLKQGVSNSSPQLKQLAGMCDRFAQRPSKPLNGTMTMTSGIDKLSPMARAALPF